MRLAEALSRPSLCAPWLPGSVALRLGSLLVSPGHEAAVGAALKALPTREQVFIAAVLPGAPRDAGAPSVVVTTLSEATHQN
jgi:hypothetical protein